MPSRLNGQRDVAAAATTAVILSRVRLSQNSENGPAETATMRVYTFTACPREEALIIGHLRLSSNEVASHVKNTAISAIIIKKLCGLGIFTWPMRLW